MKNYPGKKIVDRILSPTSLLVTLALLELSIYLAKPEYDRYIKSKQEELYHATCINRPKLVPQQLIDSMSFNLWWDSSLIMYESSDELAAIVLYELTTKNEKTYYMLDENMQPGTGSYRPRVNVFSKYKHERSKNGLMYKTHTDTRILNEMVQLSEQAKIANPDAFKE